MSERVTYHSRRVFTDTSGYYSLADPNDDDHEAATAIVARIIVERRPAFTSNYVLAETHALVLRRRGRRDAARLLADSDASSTVIVRVSAADERRARAILTRYDDKDFSLTDATSFAVMERLRIRAFFGFDDDFAQFGFTRLTANDMGS
jgi:predicted nucleic acid-binding protein